MGNMGSMKWSQSVSNCPTFCPHICAQRTGFDQSSLHYGKNKHTHKTIKQCPWHTCQLWCEKFLEMCRQCLRRVAFGGGRLSVIFVIECCLYCFYVHFNLLKSYGFKFIMLYLQCCDLPWAHLWGGHLRALNCHFLCSREVSCNSRRTQSPAWSW